MDISSQVKPSGALIVCLITYRVVGHQLSYCKSTSLLPCALDIHSDKIGRHSNHLFKDDHPFLFDLEPATKSEPISRSKLQN